MSTPSDLARIDFIASITLESSPPEATFTSGFKSSPGFVYIKANHALMNGAADVIKEAVNNNFEHKKFDWTELKQDVRNDVEKYLYKQTGRRPVVLPVVMEVNQNRHRAMARRNNQENNSEKRPVRKNHHKKDSQQKKD